MAGNLFTSLTFDDQRPIYQQIVRFVKQSLASGYLAHGDEIPSRRALAAQLGINPMTVQKAYAQMEEEGLIATQANSHSFINISDGARPAIRAELARESAREYVGRAKAMHLDFKETVDLISQLWEEVP